MIKQPHWRILYIEDQTEMIDLVRLALQSMGCDVYGASDGALGLSMMREVAPDLVLLDLMLPGLDGWKISGEMRDDPALRRVPVVLVTARVQFTASPHGRPLPEADAYVTKPFSLAQIRATVAAVLQRQVQHQDV